MDRDLRELGGAWAISQQHERTEPRPEMAGYVDHCWSVRWAYPTAYRQLIVPHLTVHLTVQRGAWTIQGVRTRPHERVLEGEGSVVGVAFRPGCFRPLLGAAVSTITDRSLPAADVLGPMPPVGDHVDVETVQSILAARVPGTRPSSGAAADAVRLVATDPTVNRADELARRLGLGLRSLQRLFAEHVGATPKWVIRRHRLDELTARLSARAVVDWARLAAELGYADQAHLIHDFRQMFGEPPTHYAARY